MEQIQLIDVTKDNWRKICSLYPGKEGAKFVASNSFSIAQSAYEEGWIIKGITYDNKLIGFTMFGYDEDIDGYELCRFMIDKKYQGFGYGQMALDLIIKLMFELYECSEIYLSTSPNNSRGKYIYEKAGFVSTSKFCGEDDNIEEIYCLTRGDSKDIMSLKKVNPQEQIDKYWYQFLEDTNRDKNTKYLNYFHFDLSEKWANELLRLVLIGQKKATACSLYSFNIENEPLPMVGDFSIVTDWEGTPRCIIETTKVTVIPFNEMTYDICKREGEDDTLESWIKGHKRFFQEEGEELGYEFHEEMPVVFEDFEVVYQ